MALLPSFPSEIAKQVKVRQDKLISSKSLTNEDILFRNNTGTFIRLTSGINVTDDIIKSLGLSGVTSGNNLAKKYKLFSARFQRKIGEDKDKNDIFNESFSQGVGYSTTYPTSYGFTSSPEFGYTPPPGIESVTIKTLNKGGLRSATINITAHNVLQFNIINTLYLKLRYSMIVEWGHNIYYNNKKELINNDIDLSGDFLNSGKSLSSLLSLVENNKKSSNGNYDALIGVVKNFTWNLAKDGSYKITIDLISAGDIAESIQINTCLNYGPTSPPDSVWCTPIQYNRSSLDRMLARFRWELDNNAASTPISEGTGLKRGYEKTGGTFSANGELLELPFSNLEMANDNTTPISQYYIKFGLLLKIIEGWLLEYDTAHDNEPTVFLDYDYDTNYCFTLTETLSSDPLTCLIPLGTPDLSKVKKYIQYKSKLQFVWYEGVLDNFTGIRAPGTWVFSSPKFIDYEGKLTDTIPTGTTLNSVWWRNPFTGATTNLDSQPVSFYKDADKDKYWPLASPGEYFPPENSTFVSGRETFILGDKADLGDRIISYTVDNPELAAFASDGILNINKDFRVNGSPYKGKLMHVLLNMNFLHRCLENKTDSNGRILLTSFLEEVLKGIQASLGYINDFVLSYDHATNTIRILDNTYLSILYNSVDPTTINVNTVTNKEGGFVKDYSLKSEVFSKQGNVLMSGAQENGNTGITNGSTFTELYKGSIDRVVTLKRNKNTTSSTGVPAKVQMTTLFDAYKTFRLKLTETSGTLTVDDIESFKSSIKDYYQYDIGQLIQKTSGGLPANKLIPLNLQLTLHGLSGMDIHQLFTVNSLLLPSDYTGKTAFVIRELTHTIDESGWTTDIGSLTILRKTKKTDDQTIEIEEASVYEGSHNDTVFTPPPTTTTSTHIAIGDSQTPAIASKSTKVGLISSTEGPSSLWQVGKDIKWLTDSVNAFTTSLTIKTVVVSIGTNGGYTTNATQAKGLMDALKLKFPNAKYIFVPGSWGWGSLTEANHPGFGYNSASTPSNVTTFYNQFSALGAIILDVPIGYTISHPSLSTPSYVTIGNRLDAIII
jgi:hypothetical protein